MEKFKGWFPIGVAIFVAGLTGGAYVNAWITTGQMAERLTLAAEKFDARLDETEQAVRVNDRRIQAIENWQGHIMQLAEARDTRIRTVENAMATFTSEISSVRGMLTQIITRLEQHEGAL